MKGLFYPRKEVIKILENKDYELWNGDCLELMKNISDKSIDMILCDLPYRYEICDLCAFGGDYLIKIEKEIELNGEELAREFWEQDCEQQAEFFNQNKFTTNEWNHSRALMQIDWLVDCLDDNGRTFIEKIYSSLQGWYDANR